MFQGAAIRTASADATTLGVEWENARVRVDLRELAEAKQDPDDPAVQIPYYKSPHAASKVETRMLCTSDAYAPKAHGFPLVSMTWDMGVKDVLNRTLEIVTGPIESTDDASWSKALAYVQLFHRELEAACTADDTYHVNSLDDGCAVPVSVMVDRLNAVALTSTTECYTKAKKNLKDPQAAKFLVHPHGQGVQEVKDRIRRIGSLKEADRPSTQVSIALDLENYTKDIDALFGNKARVGYTAWKDFNDRLKGGVAGLTDEQKAFVALYYTELHVLFDYLYGSGKDQRKLGERVVVNQPDATLTKLLEAAPINDHDAVELKNSFSLLAKTGLHTVYAKLVDTDPQRGNADASKRFPNAVFAGRDAAYFCDATYLAEDAKKIATCKEFYDHYWKMNIVAENTDPLSLSKIAGTVSPIIPTTDNKLRLVFEMRSKTDLIDARRLAVEQTDPFTLKWNGVLALPPVLPTH